MSRQRVGRYPKAFREMAVERLKGSENISALAKEFIQGLSAFQIVKETLNRHTSPDENRRSTQNFRIAMDDDRDV